MRRKPYKAFTLIEVAVTIMVVGLIVGSAMTILDRIVGAMMDMRLRADAFETARRNMETLLSSASVSDAAEYGVSEVCPEIQWQTVIEPFYEPISNAMWVRAVCSAGFTDSKGQYQELELEHWLTNLPANVVRQIIQQQKLEEEYLDLMSGTASGQTEAAMQEATRAYLAEAGLDADAYKSFLERQRRKKLDYISRDGFDEKYPAFTEELRQAENEFLSRLGMDFDKYNAFAQTYVPHNTGGDGSLASVTPDTASGSDDTGRGDAPKSGTEESSKTPPADSEQPRQQVTAEELRARGFPESLIPLILQLLNQ